MAEPLCLPRTVEQWHEMEKCLKVYLIGLFGLVLNFQARENPNNDGEGTFSFTVPSNSTNNPPKHGKGFIKALWDSKGHTYLVAQVEGKNSVRIVLAS